MGNKGRGNITIYAIYEMGKYVNMEAPLKTTHAVLYNSKCWSMIASLGACKWVPSLGVHFAF